MTAKEKAIAIFNAAVSAVQPSQLIPAVVEWNETGLKIFQQEVTLEKNSCIYIVGAGKAAAAMAVGIESIIGDRISGGVVITKYGHELPLNWINCYQAGHPVPDEAGINATTALTNLLKKANENDLVICLISGGASALLVDCPDGISLNELQRLFALLLNSGANIEEMNTVRKNFSTIKGGQLIRFAPAARWFTLVISDVPGDDLSVIASGPTVPDTSGFADALHVLKKYSLLEELPLSIKNYLQAAMQGKLAGTPKPGDPIFDRVLTRIIGSNKIAMDAAVAKAKVLGLQVAGNSTGLSGDIESAATLILQHCLEYKGGLPACSLWGGETTVHVKGKGKGGRNQQLALSAFVIINRMSEVKADKFMPQISLLVAGTDGTDGPTDAAGAIIDSELAAKVKALDVSPEPFLFNNDAYTYFEKVGGLFKTGATQTNVMDLVIAILE